MSIELNPLAVSVKNCNKIVFIATKSSPNFELWKVKNKKEKVKSNVLMKILKFIFNNLKIFFLLNMFVNLGIMLNCFFKEKYT